jgi:hypothetical protein
MPEQFTYEEKGEIFSKNYMLSIGKHLIKHFSRLIGGGKVSFEDMSSYCTLWKMEDI